MAEVPNFNPFAEIDIEPFMQAMSDAVRPIKLSAVALEAIEVAARIRRDEPERVISDVEDFDEDWASQRADLLEIIGLSLEWIVQGDDHQPTSADMLDQED